MKIRVALFVIIASLAAAEESVTVKELSPTRIEQLKAASKTVSQKGEALAKAQKAYSEAQKELDKARAEAFYEANASPFEAPCKWSGATTFIPATYRRIEILGEKYIVIREGSEGFGCWNITDTGTSGNLIVSPYTGSYALEAK